MTNRTFKFLGLAFFMPLMMPITLPAQTFDLDNVAINGVNFSETFDTDDARWADGGFAQLTYNASGGNPGGYVSSTPMTILDESAVFRAHDAFDSSGDAFVGDWIAQGTNQITFDFRHDYPTPVSVFARVATPQNFPAHNAISFVPIPPGQWTSVQLSVAEGTPGLINEGEGIFDYAATFANVGNLQIGISGVPEPAAVTMIIPIAVTLVLIRRRRK